MSELTGPGDCYEASASALCFYHATPRGTLLVHGLVTGRAGEAEGLRYGHSWLEFEEDSVRWVLDVSEGKRLQLPRELYYALGDIRGEEITRYREEEARVAMFTHRHYGPWEK